MQNIAHIDVYRDCMFAGRIHVPNAQSWLWALQLLILYSGPEYRIHVVSHQRSRA